MVSFGILVNQYHSEVLDYIIELLNDIYINPEIVIYNLYETIDWYKNIDFYIKKYENIKLDNFNLFINRFVNNEHYRIFVPTLDDPRFRLNIFLLYKQYFIFITHTQTQIDICNNYGLNYFSLAYIVSKDKIKYMMPLIKNTKLEISYVFDNKELYDLELLNDKLKKESLTPLLMVGLFTNKNKNINYIENLLKTKKIYIIVCTTNVSVELHEMIDKYPSYFTYCMRLSNLQIRYMTEKLNIKYLLFCPKIDSSFYYNLYSGSIAFAFNNNYILVLPENIATKYNFMENCIISYKENENVKELLKLLEYNEISFNSIQKYRNTVFKRNKILMKLYLQLGTGSFLMNTIYGYLFIKKNSIKHDNSVIDQANRFITNNYTIIDIGSNIGFMSLALLSLNKTINIYSFEADSDNTELQKNTMLINDYVDRIKIYNNFIGHDCIKDVTYKNKKTDMFNLDFFNFDNISLININSNLYNFIIYGAKNTIIKHSPHIFYKNNLPSYEKIDIKDIDNDIKNFKMEEFLEKLGYTKYVLSLVDINDYIYWIC